MPTVGVFRDALFERLGRRYTDKEFDELCFEFGVELDDITSEAIMDAKEKGKDVAAAEGSDHAVIYKIDVPANRYDLLCIEGIARALRIFLGLEAPPEYVVTDPADGMYTMTVEADCKRIRPYVVSAVLRGMDFSDKAVYDSFIDLQDKLHQNLCRRRTLVAIGTHDMATLKPPFRYRALPPKDIHFVPLSQSKDVNAEELMEIYRNDAAFRHIKPYVDIIADSPVYPVIYDANDVVLSLPPIINGEHSKINPETKDVFIECTATDLTKGKIVLNTVVTMFSEYCSDKFHVEPVRIVYEDGSTESYVTPNLDDREARAKVAEITKIAGVPIEPPTVVELCSKMQLPARYDADAKEVVVKVPPTRSDILHQCDIVEDVAIAYGFNKIPKTIPQTVTVGRQQPMNRLTDLMRAECGMAGYTEVMTMALCSHDENFKDLRRKETTPSAVVLENPKTVEFQIVRTSLLPGLLKTLRENRGVGVRDGIKIFEISDVVTLSGETDTGARNTRKLAAVYTGPTAGLEIVHGLIDKVMTLVQAVPTHLDELSMAGAGAAASAAAAKRGDYAGLEYRIVPGAPEGEGDTYFGDRVARVEVRQVSEDGETEYIPCGTFGVLHPTVLDNFELKFPASVLEITLEPFV